MVVKLIPDPTTVGVYSPSQVTIRVGQAVQWSSYDPNVQHSVTAFDGTFDSTLLSAGAKFRVSFSKPGTYQYHCIIHPLMSGTVVVK